MKMEMEMEIKMDEKAPMDILIPEFQEGRLSTQGNKSPRG